MTSACIAERYARQAEPVFGGGGAAEEAKLGFQEGAWLFIAVAIPLAFNPAGVQVFDLPKIALLRTVVIAMAALWLWRRLSAHRLVSEQGARVAWSDPVLWAGGLGLVYTIATLVSPDLGLSFWGSYSRQEGLYTTLVYLLLFALVATELRQPKQAERLALAVALGSLPIVLYGLFQVAGLDPIPWQTLDKSPALATIGRSNFVGSYLAMSIPLSIAALVISRWAWLRAILALIVLSSLALLALTNARAAWVAIVVAGLALLALCGWRKGGWRNVAPYAGLACAALVVFAAAYLASLWMAGLIQAGTLLRLPELSGSLAARLAIWQASLQLIAERPFLGFGPDGFYLAFYHVFPPQLVFYQGRGLVTDRAHDAFLQQAINAGVLGLAVYLALLATLMAKLVRGLNLSEGRGRVVAAAMLAAALGHLVDLLFNFDVASTAAVFWIVAGAGVGLTRPRAENRVLPSADAQMPTGGLPKWRRAAAGTFVAAALAIVLGSSVLPLVADTFAGRSLRPGVPLAERLDDAARAVGIWPFEPAHRAGLGLVYLDYARFGADPRPALDAAERELSSSAAIRPRDPLLWAMLADGRAYRAARLGDVAAFAGAEASYVEAITLAPTTATLHAALGALELAGGRLDAAEASLERAVALDTTDGRAWSTLAEVYRAQGRANETATAVSNALRWQVEAGRGGK